MKNLYKFNDITKWLKKTIPEEIEKEYKITEGIRWYKNGKLEKSKESIKSQNVEKDILVIHLTDDIHYLLTSWEHQINYYDNDSINLTNYTIYDNYHIKNNNLTVFITKKLYRYDTIIIYNKDHSSSRVKVFDLPKELLKRLNCEIESQ
jgi:hypothetical protein